MLKDIIEAAIMASPYFLLLGFAALAGEIWDKVDERKEKKKRIARAKVYRHKDDEKKLECSRQMKFLYYDLICR